MFHFLHLSKMFSSNESWLCITGAPKLLFSFVILWQNMRCCIGQPLWADGMRGRWGVSSHLSGSREHSSLRRGKKDVLWGQLEEHRALFRESWVFAELITCSLRKKKKNLSWNEPNALLNPWAPWAYLASFTFLMRWHASSLKCLNFP